MTDIALEILEPSGIPSSEQNEQSSPRGGESFAWPASTGAVSTPLKSGLHRASHPAADGLHSACGHDPRHRGHRFIFGPVDVIFAPMTVVLFILIKKLHVRDFLHEQAAIPGEQR
jgi:hypothetical protein